MKRVIVTGASGFIGRQVVPLLAGKGWEVHAVAYPAVPDIPGCVWHTADLLAPEVPDELMRQVKPEYLLHLAWYAEPGKYWNSPENFRWVTATMRLAEAFGRVGGKHLVAAGTCAEYDWAHGRLSEDSTPLVPSTIYGMCKNAARQLLQAYAAEYGIRVAWGRVFYLYGPHEHPSRLVPSVINSLLRGDTAKCTHGRQVRDFLHVEDVARAFVALLEESVSGAVNIASGKPVALNEIMTAVAEELGARSLLRLGAIPAPEGEPQLLVGDNAKLSSIGWVPAYSLSAGLKNAVAWWKAELKRN